MKNLRFNELTNKEIYEILKLRSEVFILEQQIIYVDQDDIDYHANHLFMADEKGVFGYLRIIDKKVKYPDAYVIGRLCVRKDKRNQGVARSLMLKAINYLKNERIIISAQKYLESFYHSLGFTTISDTYLEEGIVHVKMELNND